MFEILFNLNYMIIKLYNTTNITYIVKYIAKTEESKEIGLRGQSWLSAGGNEVLVVCSGSSNYGIGNLNEFRQNIFP